ncbi:Transposon TX1 uncharacterized 149 kDa protein [Linum grandiflorum]
MIVLGWNCRGLGNSRAVQVLGELITAHRPDVVFLSETLVSSHKMEEIRVKVGFEGCFTVDVRGRSGGLGMLWKAKAQLMVRRYADNFIDTEVINGASGTFRLTGFYGFPERERRPASWDLLRSLGRGVNLPWCIIGDFNDILHQHEQKGRHERPQPLIDGFRMAVAECNLVDVTLDGYPFTWSRAKGKAHGVESRLDRAMVNPEWILKYPGGTLRNVIAPVSDHSPILLDSAPQRREHRVWHFRFENAWRMEAALKPLVEEKWSEREELSMFEKLRACVEAMTEWGRGFARRFRAAIVTKRKELEELREGSGEEAADAEQRCRDELLVLLQQEEAYWKQREKQFWLKDGERNTRFFHMSANGRRKWKNVKHLIDEEGRTVEDSVGMGDVAMRYFGEIFSGGGGDPDTVTNEIGGRVTVPDNDVLLSPFSKEEFRVALFSMDADKAPGPDGLNPGFYQHFWELVGDDLYAAGRRWLDDGVLPEELWDTNIVLLPKVDDPVRMADLRPISLCSVLYRIVAKVLANRLRRVIPKVISEEQSAFVAGRSIVDNVMAAFEAIHSMKKRYNGKWGEAAVKINISKAYDRVEWRYLEAMLTKFGFAERWVQWMMMCVTSVRYTVLLNGERVGPIMPSRGLRQGCPLSPFLFILCAEGLSAMIKKAVADDTLHGTRVCRGSPTVTHLLFADDSFFFARATIPDARALKEIFDKYAAASGQLINFQKSGIMCSRNTHPMLKDGIEAILDIHNPLDTGRYLGLPSCVGRNKRQIFQHLKERIWKRIQVWRGRKLSMAGREVLIKAVAQAIPTYFMNTFLFTDGMIKEIERLMNSFWWSSGGGGGVRWMRWERLSVRKEFGGMGFRNPLSFNLAMLGKQGWKLLTDPNALVSRIYKAKYFPKVDFLSAALGSNPSYIWRSIRSTQRLLVRGSRWRLGDGGTVQVWKDPWLRSETNCWVETPCNDELSNLHVSDLLIPGLAEWDEELIEELFVERDVSHILQLAPPTGLLADQRIWHYSRNGVYSVKAAHRLCTEVIAADTEHRRDGDWSKIWHLDIPHRMRHFLWRIARHVLPTRTDLASRRVQVPLECGLCSSYDETLWHLFLECSTATRCWEVAGLRSIITDSMDRVTSIDEWLFDLLTRISSNQVSDLVAVLWGIWKERNDRVWQHQSKFAELIVDLSRKQIEEWRAAQLLNRPNPTSTTHPTCSKWHRPPVGVFKLNVDFALFAAQRKYGIGMALRGRAGQLMGYKQMLRGGTPEPQVGEAQAVLEGLTWAMELGFQRVIIATDCLAVRKALVEVVVDLTEFGVVIEECKVRLAAKPDFTAEFYRRDSNGVAHTLARRAISSVVSVVGEAPPVWLNADLANICFSDSH